MSRSDPQFNLRIPEDLRDRVMASAKSSKRSATAEIIARLTETFDIEKVLENVAPGAPVVGTYGLLQDLHDQLEALADENHELRIAGHAQALTEHLSYNTAMLDKINSELSDLKNRLGCAGNLVDPETLEPVYKRGEHFVKSPNSASKNSKS